MFKSFKWGEEIPTGFAKSSPLPGSHQEEDFGPHTAYWLKLPLWSKEARMYNIRIDDMVQGTWRLMLLFRYVKGSPFFFRKSWALERRDAVRN